MKEAVCGERGLAPTSQEMGLIAVEGRGVGQAVGLSRRYSTVLGRLANLTSMMSRENHPTGSLAHGFGASVENTGQMGVGGEGSLEEIGKDGRKSEMGTGCASFLWT